MYLCWRVSVAIRIQSVLLLSHRKESKDYPTESTPTRMGLVFSHAYTVFVCRVKCTQTCFESFFFPKDQETCDTHTCICGLVMRVCLFWRNRNSHHSSPLPITNPITTRTNRKSSDYISTCVVEVEETPRSKRPMLRKIPVEPCRRLLLCPIRAYGTTTRQPWR